jgi:hypothetical protein
MSAEEVYEAKMKTDNSSCYRIQPLTTEKPADGSMNFTIMKHPKEALDVMSTR